MYILRKTIIQIFCMAFVSFFYWNWNRTRHHLRLPDCQMSTLLISYLLGVIRVIGHKRRPATMKRIWCIGSLKCWHQKRVKTCKLIIINFDFHYICRWSKVKCFELCRECRRHNETNQVKSNEWHSAVNWKSFGKREVINRTSISFTYVVTVGLYFNGRRCAQNDLNS